MPRFFQRIQSQILFKSNSAPFLCSIYIGSLFILPLALTISGAPWKGSGNVAVAAESLPEVPLSLLAATPTRIVKETERPGRLEAFRQADVLARVSGIVLEKRYDEGQEVKKGDVLFIIDPAPFKVNVDIASAALTRSKADLLSAADKLKRHKELIDAKAVSERDQAEAIADEQRAKAGVAAAEAELAKAKLQLSYATVTAPISGRARKAMVTEGAAVGYSGPTTLTTIEQISPIYVNFSQPASEVFSLQKSIKAGALHGIAQSDVTVRLKLPDGTFYDENGKLIFSDLAVDPGTDAVVMRAEFNNPERQLLPGAYVTVNFETAIDSSAYLVPRDAVMRQGTANMVLVMGEKGPEPRPVTAETMLGKYWIVTSGLKTGDMVLSDPMKMPRGEALKGIQLKPVVIGKTPEAPRDINGVIPDISELGAAQAVPAPSTK